MTHSPRPVVWSIAGSDSGAGAGIQADLRAFDSFELHGCTAVAAVTAQNSLRVERVDALPTDQLDAQLAALAGDLAPRAIKVGMLASAENVRCVARWVDVLRRRAPLALVVDPVWRASTGATLGDGDLRAAILAELLPRASALTPNRTEAAWLLGGAELATPASVEQAGAALRALGAAAVMITGGDAGGQRALDWIDTAQTRGWLELARVDTPHHHGSGCVYAASVAAAMALDFCAADAAVLAKMNVTAALGQGRGAGQGAGPVRPLAGFALRGHLLPTLGGPQAGGAPFAALSEPRLGLYAVVDSAAWVERVLAAGVRTVQLRIKQASAAHLTGEIARSVLAARAAGAQLFINDHWQLALERGAYGVHLGQEDLATADLDTLRRAGLRLGISTHTLWEVCRARAHRPSYLACGPVYPTTTKDMPWLPQGEHNLAYWSQLLSEPLVAIGGMDLARSARAMACGAAGVAVLRGIVTAADPESAIAALQRAIAGAARSSEPPALPRSALGWQSSL
ncbi:MAG: bifunctional hydroxymethylpyrimidine kinase/phosphomethylpyrimidine kinase [Pseudomonadota bacterium]